MPLYLLGLFHADHKETHLAHLVLLYRKLHAVLFLADVQKSLMEAVVDLLPRTLVESHVYFL